MQDTGVMNRIFIATFVSFVFFIFFDYFFVQPTTSKVENISEVKKETTKTISKNNSLLKTQIVSTIKSDSFEIQIDNLGRIHQYILEKNIFNDNKGDKLKIVSQKLPKILEIRFKDKELNTELFNSAVSVDRKEIIIKEKPETITITQKLKELTIKKILTFYPDGHYQLKIELSKDVEYYLAVGRVEAEVTMYSFHGALLEKEDGSLEMIDDGDAENSSFKNIKIAASVDHYYTTFLYDLKNGMNVIETMGENDKPLLYIVGKQNLSLGGYIGPKYVKVLDNINPELTKVVEYGIMTFLAKPMFALLYKFYEWTKNWGIATILFVILVRIILFPLTYRGMASMYKMKILAPKLKEIKEKYSKDPKKFQLKTMELYKKENVNPLGGCLPMLIQIPIFFAIYRVLVNAIELKGAGFLWIDDLSVMDPYFILPILMGVTMYAHQMITPNNFTDPMQEKIFKFLPVIFTFFMITFSAGLVLYWTINNVLSFMQQFIINKSMEAKGLIIKSTTSKDNKK